VEEDTDSDRDFPRLPSKPHKTPVVPRTCKRPTVQTQEVSPPETDYSEHTQPYGSSCILPGKIAGKAATFLLDTGCTTNLLSRRLFDTLGARERESLKLYDGEQGTLADGSSIPFYGLISLPGRVRDLVIRETFIVSHLKEDAILGMPFLEKHRCHMYFNKSAVVVAGKEFSCVDKFGRPLVGGIPKRSQATLLCKVNCKEISELRVVEGMHGRVQLAKSLNRLDCHGEFLVQCINHYAEPVKLSAGSLVSRYNSVQETDVGPTLDTASETPGYPLRSGTEPVPEHVAELYQGACGDCGSNVERRQMAQLL